MRRQRQAVMLVGLGAGLAAAAILLNSIALSVPGSAALAVGIVWWGWLADRRGQLAALLIVLSCSACNGTPPAGDRGRASAGGQEDIRLHS